VTSPNERAAKSRQPEPEENGFSGFDFGTAIQRGIKFAGYEDPRPIQTQTIPAVLAGRDVLGLAQTGTGKTAAFALPILEKLMAKHARRPSVLVLAPTRELANQIQSDISALGQFTPVRSLTVYGGVSLRGQVQGLRKKPNIVVACPGRLLDLYRQKAIDFDGINTLVIDEADQMFDMGFMPDVRRIIDALPRERQTLLFSATMPKEIRKLADSVLHKPVVVDVGHSSVVSTIDHELYPVSQKHKMALLQHLLQDDDFSSAIVFMRTKHRALKIARQLKTSGFNAVALQGNMSQGQRDRAMLGFRRGQYNILVATDIAARGLDVANISHVINFDFPNTPDSYIHRIGRTGRSEQSGKAFTLICPEDEPAVTMLERKLGRKVNRCVLPTYTELPVIPELAAAVKAAMPPKQGKNRKRTQKASSGKASSGQPKSALERAQERLGQNSGGPRRGKTHGGFQQTRGKDSRARHRKHAARAN
jgi:ATP-dependent RNA helicase RhlE